MLASIHRKSGRRVTFGRDAVLNQPRQPLECASLPVLDVLTIRRYLGRPLTSAVLLLRLAGCDAFNHDLTHTITMRVSDAR